MRVVLLAGLDAPTGGQAQNNPHPILMRVLDPAQLPNRYMADMKDCVVTANGYGDISSERAYIRTDRLSCIDQKGGAVDVSLKGYVAGEDGKAGMRGRLVSKQGQALANAFLAGIGSGIGQAFTGIFEHCIDLPAGFHQHGDGRRRSCRLDWHPAWASAMSRSRSITSSWPNRFFP